MVSGILDILVCLYPFFIEILGFNFLNQELDHSGPHPSHVRLQILFNPINKYFKSTVSVV